MARSSYGSGRAFGGTALPPAFSAKEFAALHAYVGKAKRNQTPRWLRFMRLFAVRPADASAKAPPPR